MPSIPLYKGESKDITDNTRKTAQIGLVAKMDKLPSLIINEPVKFCSASEPKIMPIITPGTPIPILYMKYPTIPCNDCKYCMPCPYALDIPGILLHYNKCVNEGNVPKSAQDENYAKARRAFLVGYDRSVPKLRQANHCTGCEQCNPHCPQGIDIPKEMQRIDKFVEELKVNG